MLAGMPFFVRKLKFLQRKKANVKEKKNIFSCLVIILVAIANVTDNDLLSYGFLPFCISSINNIFATKTKKVRL